MGTQPLPRSCTCGAVRCGASSAEDEGAPQLQLQLQLRIIARSDKGAYIDSPQPSKRT